MSLYYARLSSLRLRRLPACTWGQSEKFARFRGVLAVGLSRIRTGDGGFAASKAQQSAFFSVGKLGGSDSLLIRPSQPQKFRDPYREFEFLIGQVRRFVFAPDSPKRTESSNITRSAN